MKKMLLLLFLASLTGLAHASNERSYDRGAIFYKLSVAANVSTSAVVIDLSDTVNFPHRRTGELQIYRIRTIVDKAAASTETVKLGVVNFVNASTGSVTYFYEVPNALNVSNTVNQTWFDSDLVYNLQVKKSATPDTNGSTPNIVSSDIISGSTVFQTDVNLPTPIGNTPPGVGDLILSVVNGTAAVDVYLEILYESAN